MIDDEYLALLEALATKHLRGSAFRLRRHDEMAEMQHAVERLESLARLNRVVAERAGVVELSGTLARELKHSPLAFAQQVMERAGIVDALEDMPDIVFEHLRAAALPAESAEMLRRAGLVEPEAEITLLIAYARKHIGGASTRPSQILREGREQLEQMALRLEAVTPRTSPSDERRPKRRKMFDGIAKILAGGLTGIESAALAAGPMASSRPAPGHDVIASSTLAIGLISQGIGDLRGE